MCIVVTVGDCVITGTITSCGEGAFFNKEGLVALEEFLQFLLQQIAKHQYQFFSDFGMLAI